MDNLQCTSLSGWGLGGVCSLVLGDL